MNKKFLHIDMDAFYVSVEIRDNPKLINQPVAVGGASNRRGVLSTCNYIARQFGVHSAMPTALALKKCPDLIVLPGRMQVYKEVSQQIRQIFAQYTDKIEPLSLDEAYLDVSNSSLHNGSATLLAQTIRQQILQTTGLTASAGIAPIKFLAKIASDLNKPNGQYTIKPEQVQDFIDKLELKKIPGVGKVTWQKLQNFGLNTGLDVRNSSLEYLHKHFGKYGQVLWRRCHGIDEREVETERVRKSVGVERTFSQDFYSYEQLNQILTDKLLPELNRRLEPYLANRQLEKIGIKLKFSDFQLTTKEQQCQTLDHTVLRYLLQEGLNRFGGKAQKKGVRLLGIQVGLSEQQGAVQLKLALD
ncbi:DNA polymerase IV [Catenovulum agarivorans]|uniref:DNA polymerase IV n=1 Tax=Catenovulum agarivorans TaxID=1172192 RepID=UPI0002F7A3A9|nr:DNA polymerase IV [Catenovulum agarivorans]